MSEQITTYLLRDVDIPLPMDRKKYYEEQIKAIKSGGKSHRAVEAVALLLFNRSGEIILQKRSHEKAHNPYLIDKSIGGHIQYGDSPIYTTMVETVQELQVPSIVLRNDNDFQKTLKLLFTYLDSVAVIKELDTQLLSLNRIINKKHYEIAHKVHIYMGVYGGAIKPVDKEASGILYYNLDALRKEMKHSPDNFTSDLNLYLEKYGDEIERVLNSVRQLTA